MTVSTRPRPRRTAVENDTNRTVTVTVVEDHPVVALGVRHMLADARRTEWRGTYRDVAALLADPAARACDVVLLDPHLSDGSETADNVARLREWGLNVLVLAARHSTYVLRQAVEAGALGIVHTSAGPEELVTAVRTAAHGRTVAPPPPSDDDGETYVAILSRRERETIALYAAGEKSERVAELLGISQETVNDYIGRVRAKYRRAGRSADTKVDLYKRAVEDGILPAPGVVGV